MIPWHQYLLGLVFLLAGFFHLHKPKVYLRIMPPYIPEHKLAVLLSGIVEMVLGLMLLNSNTKIFAAWGIIILMVLFLPVHFYMLQNERASLNLPQWMLVLRIPLQFGIMYWAFQYA